MTDANRLVLASASPRRQELLRAAGIGFDIHVSDIAEIHDPAMSPAELTILNALRKAGQIAALHPGRRVLGADTLVYVDGEPLGKPADMREAAAMLTRLSDRWHEVCTGLAVCRHDQGARVIAVTSRVRFGPLTPDTIARYHAVVHPLDKAGGYAIQEHATLLGAVVDGPLDNVIGLPVEATRRLLQSFP